MKVLQTSNNIYSNVGYGNRDKSKNYYKKESKNHSIPVFLLKTSETEKYLPADRKIYGDKEKYPSTERHFTGKPYLYVQEFEKTGLNIISSKSIGESSDGDTRSRHNTTNVANALK